MAHVIHAPELDRPGLTWFNVPKPLSLAALAGKLVILDFWTFANGSNRLLVVDTNNHRIVTVDLAQRTTETWFR